MSDFEFGPPIKVDPATRPHTSGNRGKPSLTPAFEKWLKQLKPGAEYELPSTDKDGAHPVSRLNSLRKIAKEKGGYVIDGYPVVSNKRYRIFAQADPTVLPMAPNGAKPVAKKAVTKVATEAPAN